MFELKVSADFVRLKFANDLAGKHLSYVVIQVVFYRSGTLFFGRFPY